ncbi:MAG TPA: Na+/H+ antiporter NhaC family protein, partial [Lentibacillus sp.]|nr:Na+/H+ antiporter NhaC family protein [Lentibacillus sp.]
QGILPYGAQLLAVAGVASISPVSIMPYSIYPVLLGIAGIIAIATGYPRFSTGGDNTALNDDKESASEA